MSELLHNFVDLFVHLPDHLGKFTNEHGTLVYVLLFAIIFCETGLVVTPFLPGDSLLFAVGAIASDPATGLSPWIAGAVMLIAAILGDTVNYWIGRRGGDWMMRKFPRFVKPAHIEKTSEFFERYGGKTIIIARFVPIVRTFAPFVAGSGCMNYRRFMAFNVVGALLWVGLLVPAGMLFYNTVIDFTVLGVHIKFSVKERFELVVLGIIGISVLPMVIEIARAKLRARQPAEAE